MRRNAHVLLPLLLAPLMAAPASASRYPEGDDAAGLVMVDLRVIEKPDAIVLSASLLNDGDRRVHVRPTPSLSWSVEYPGGGFGGGMGGSSYHCGGVSVPSIPIDPGKRITLDRLEVERFTFKGLPIEGRLSVRLSARVVRVDAAGSPRAAFHLHGEQTLLGLPSAPTR